ncbi:MAG: tetratricopeptide repeat protein [Actinobacteria bacterium]|nr:MAG: tetratricopeptide repeat protein [Actinomycetota bacterium]
MEKEELLARYEARGDAADFEEAKRLYEDALAADPGDAGLHNAYGYLLECRGRLLIREALRHYEEAISLEPDWAKPRFQLISAHVGLQQADDAVAISEQYAQDRPDDVTAARVLATAYVHARRYDRAAALIDAALRRFPDDARLVELRGDVAAGTGRVEDALRDWERAHELDPESLSSVYSRAFLLQREGRLADAADAWRHIIEWSQTRGYELEAEWPRRELERVLARL